MKREKKLFIGCFNKSVILTYIGVVFALTGIFTLVEFQENELIERMNFVMFCLIISGLCDLFDGFIARKCKRNEIQKAFGIQIERYVILFHLSYFHQLFYIECQRNIVLRLYLLYL